MPARRAHHRGPSAATIDDVSPISGVLLGGSKQAMSVAVDVTVAS